MSTSLHLRRLRSAWNGSYIFDETNTGIYDRRIGISLLDTEHLCSIKSKGELISREYRLLCLFGKEACKSQKEFCHDMRKSMVQVSFAGKSQVHPMLLGFDTCIV